MRVRNRPKNREVGWKPKVTNQALAAKFDLELGPIARNEFVRIVDELAKLKRLNTLDVASVAMYSNAYAGWLEALAAIKEFGPIVKGASGYPNQSPYVNLANQHAATMMRCSSGFA
jgi:P27 family predicted phage terminase small subunit